MKKIILVLGLLVSFNSFALTPPPPDSFWSGPTDSDSFEKSEKIENLEEILNHAEDNADIVGRKILETSRLMIANQEIVLGSCWDYINAIYTRAGYPHQNSV